MNDRSWLSYPLAVSTTSKEQKMKRESKNEWFSLFVLYYLYAPPNWSLPPIAIVHTCSCTILYMRVCTTTIWNWRSGIALKERKKSTSSATYLLPTVPCCCIVCMYRPVSLIAHRSPYPLKWRVLLSLYLPTQSGNNKSFVRRILRISILFFSPKKIRNRIFYRHFSKFRFTQQ